MSHSVWNRRIPSLFVFFFLIASFFTISYLTSNNKSTFFSFASLQQTPQEVTVSNITDTSFTVTYHTAANVLGSVLYESGTAVDIAALDDRDNGAPKLHTVHSVTVKNLAPSSTYSFRILSGGATYDNNGAAYTIKTGKQLPVQDSHMIQGKVIFPTGVTEALILIATKGSEPLSRLTDATGAFQLDINQLRNADGTEYAPLNGQQFIVVVQTATSQAKALVPFAQLSTIPPITLGNTYAFSSKPIQPVASTSASQGFPQQSFTPSVQKKVTISIPAEGQSFTVQQPTFSGTSAPYAVISITIHSDEQIQTSVQADSKGFWTYTPLQAFSPGQHTLTITAKDALLINRTLSAVFYIYSQGAQFLQPSVSPIQPTPTLILSVTPGIGGNPSPTPTNTPTLTPTTAALPSPSPVLPTNTPTLTPTPPPLLSPTGISPTSQPLSSTPTPTLTPGSESAFIAIFVALIPVILGAFLIYLSKGVIRS